MEYPQKFFLKKLFYPFKNSDMMHL